MAKEYNAIFRIKKLHFSQEEQMMLPKCIIKSAKLSEIM